MAAQGDSNQRSRHLFRLGMLGLLFLLLVPLTVWTALNFQRAHDAAEEDAYSDAIALSERAGARSETLLGMAGQLVSATATLPVVREARTACDATMAAFINGSELYSNLFAANGQGVVYCSANPAHGLSVANRTYFQRAEQTSNITIGELVFSQRTRRPVIVVATPILDNGFQGIVGATLNLDHWALDLHASARANDAVLSVVDAAGVIAVHTENPGAYIGQPHPHLEAILGKTSGSLLGRGPDGIERVYGFHAIQDVSGTPAAYVVAGRPRAAVIGLIEDGFQRQYVGLVLTAAVGLGATWGISELTLVRQDRKLRASETRYRDLSATLEQQVQQRTGDLQEAYKELEAFAYSVSHDLRAPLRSLDGFSKILLDEYRAALPEQGQHYLNLVLDSAAEMTQLIDALLHFSRVGRQELALRTVSVRSLVDHVITDLKPTFTDRDVRFDIGDLPEAQADPILLRQVFANLLGNAVKFTRDRKPAIIEVGSTIDDGQTTFFVKDNGVGFDMKYADKLYGIFQRLHRAEEFEGNGVGLALVQRIVQRHGGRVWATAEAGKGAQFFFTLPGGTQP